MEKTTKKALIVFGIISSLVATYFFWWVPKQESTATGEASPAVTDPTGTVTPPVIPATPASPAQISAIRAQIVSKLKEIYMLRKNIITASGATQSLGTMLENPSVLNPANDDAAKLIMWLSTISDYADLESMYNYFTSFSEAMKYWKAYPADIATLETKYPAIIIGKDPAKKNLDLMKKYFASQPLMILVSEPSAIKAAVASTGRG